MNSIHLLRYNIHVVKYSKAELGECLRMFTLMEAPSEPRSTFPYHPQISQVPLSNITFLKRKVDYYSDLYHQRLVLPLLELHTKGIFYIFYIWLLSFNMTFMRFHPYCSMY